MSTIIVVVLFLLGLLLIIKGGDLFVDAASWIAKASGIPQFLIGATIVSIATTLPELLVSIMAAAEHDTEMAIGNAVGSVTANTGLIMAFSLVFMPTLIVRKQFAPKALIMVVSGIALTLLSAGNGLTVTESIILLLLAVVFIAENIHVGRKELTEDDHEPIVRKDLVRNLVTFVVGAVALVVGARLLVDNGTELATLLGVPQRVIAVTMVAIGTSLPELVTAVTAVIKKESNLSVGNILGANIIDITVILPICAIISGGTLPVAAASLSVDMPVLCAELLLAVVPTLVMKKFTRVQGGLMLAVYLGYLVYTVIL